jgi:OmpR-family two-component system manganese-sensing response regulator
VAKILIVEDEIDVSFLLKIELEAEGYVVELAEDGNLAWDLMSAYEYDVIILDWQVPGFSGIELCAKLRQSQKGAATPVLMLTGRGSIADKTCGLDTGADDYLTKPFDTREVAARVRALLRRFGGTGTNQIVCGDLVFDLKSKTFSIAGEAVKLLPKEQALIEFLMRNPNEVFSPEALLERVWHSDSQVAIGTVYTTMKTLRKKIAEIKDSCPIETVHGLGYKLVN